MAAPVSFSRCLALEFGCACEEANLEARLYMFTVMLPLVDFFAFDPCRAAYHVDAPLMNTWTYRPRDLGWAHLCPLPFRPVRAVGNVTSSSSNSRPAWPNRKPRTRGYARNWIPLPASRTARPIAFAAAP